MNKGTSKTVKVLTLLIFMIVSQNQLHQSINNANSQTIVETLSQEPSGTTIAQNENVSIILTTNPVYNVVGINLLYCQILPTFLCHYPGIALNSTDNITYYTWFIPEYSLGSTLGYHFIIDLANNTCVEYPTEVDMADYSNIRAGDDGTFYFILNITATDSTESKTSVSSPSFTSTVVVTTLLLITVVLLRRKITY